MSTRISFLWRYLLLTPFFIPWIIATADEPQVAVAQQLAANPLPSWNDQPSRKAILEFVDRVTREGGSDFVPISERIVVFDNDGTLWTEQPMYVQAIYAFDRVKELEPQHPEWRTTEPFASVLRGDLKSALAGGERSLLELVMATHAGMTTEEFERSVSDWMGKAKHPKTGRLFTEMVYTPMLEMLSYLRSKGFKTYIVSGGGIEFMRPWSEKVYGVPPEQVIGSSIKTRFEIRDGKPVLVRLPELNFVDDKAGKPVAIHLHIGRRPIMAFGNSDGDLEMLQWTTANDRPNLAVLVRHTDADREYQYDRESHVGRLDQALDVAQKLGWVVIDMKQDWNRIYPDR
jgi:phosphoserine phosphatase